MTRPEAVRPRVLIVDDELPVREAVADFLEDEGFDVRTAASGAEALGLARAQRFVACILDLRMPGMSGTELALELRALSPETPLLIITGSPDFVPGKSLRAVGIGPDDTLVKPYDLPVLAAKIRARIEGSAVKKEAVLVVEDELPNRGALVDYLEDEGFQVIEASDGIEALEKLASQSVDVVLTDLKMPRMSGIELLERIRERWPGLPCIIASGQGQMSDAIAAVRLGAEDYIEKPLMLLDRVGIAVRRAIEHQRLLRENRVNLAELERRNASLAESNAALARAKRELEEAQEQLVHAGKMAALGEMVAGVAHEINNPLGFVYSNVRTLADTLVTLRNLAKGLAEKSGDGNARTTAKAEIDRLAQRVERLLEGCRTGTERTREIVERLRRFARPGEATLHSIDLTENLDAAVTFVSHRLGDGVKLHRDYAPVPRVFGRGGEINQVFVNLLANALDAVREKGQIWLAVRERSSPPRTAARERAGSWVEVVVHDSGPGFPPEAEAKLFEPFFTTKPPGHGTGLGLSVSYGIVRYHGGVIEARNHPEGGAEFRVILPVIAAPAQGRERRVET